MSKRRKSKMDELLLIPFLDILCSLIGVLVLIIVALSVAQTLRAKGITTKQFEMAQRHQKLVQELKPLQEEEERLKKLLAEQKKDQDRTVELGQKKKDLEESIKNATEENRKNKEEQEKLTAKLADLNAKMEEQKKSPSRQEEIKQLQQILTAKQGAGTVNTKPKLVIHPSGSGLTPGRLFFAEAFPNGLLLHLGGKETFKFMTYGLRENPDYRKFLTRLKTIPNSSMIFLIRRGGEQVYKLAGAIAEFDFGLKISKVPLPEGGDVDLSSFDSNQAFPAAH